MKNNELITFIRNHPDLGNNLKIEEKTITVDIKSQYFMDRKFLESIIKGVDNYFCITGKFIVFYKSTQSGNV